MVVHKYPDDTHLPTGSPYGCFAEQILPLRLLVPKVGLETRLEEVIRKSPELTYKSLGEILAVSAATVKRTMAKMQQEGKIIREGSNRKGKWILTDKK